MRQLGIVAGLLCLLAGAPRSAADTVETHSGITLELPGLSSRSIEHEQVKGAWTGTIGASDVHVELRVFSGERFRFFQPGAVTRMLAANRAEREGGFRFATRELVDGPFGAEPFASVCSGPIEGGSVLTFGGLLDGKSSYSIVIEARPALSDADRKVAIAMVKNGIEVVCNPVDPRWTEKEAQARWNAAVRDEATRKGLRKVRRTKHYIIFTNSSGGALFAKKMEQYYKTIQKTFPFAERKARRLMPVFLLRTREEYVKFTVHNARMNMAQAAATKGHAFLDYYATYYESPNDPVHIHEATHQIFKNRLHLDGGGSWFQEGVAEYMSTRRSARKAWARRAARDDKHVGFRDFVTIRTLIANPYTDGKSAYLQAASLIDFLRDGKWQRDKFPAFLEEIGTLRRADADAIEAKLKAIYGTELQGLEEAWQKHWKR